MDHTMQARLDPQEAARQRDLDAAVRATVPFFGWREYMSFAPGVITELRASWVREAFARIHNERRAQWRLEGQDDAEQRNGTNTITNAARALSCAGHTKRKATISRTTEQLKSELARGR